VEHSDKPIQSPFVIAVDTRENRPFTFAGLRADARQQNRPLQVRTAVKTLASGDYSVEGLEDLVAVERKSKADLFGTLGQGRERFERELARLQEMRFAAVVIEADWPDILLNPPGHSGLNPKSLFRSVIAWQQRYHRVHWWACAGRAMAQTSTYRILERFYRDDTRGKMVEPKRSDS
jgi:DNA excision repair protein ERCC-4